jgi:hypothetical protein
MKFHCQVPEKLKYLCSVSNYYIFLFIPYNSLSVCSPVALEINMRRLICVRLFQRTDPVCGITEISDMATTDRMALIIIQLLNYNLGLEIKERKLQEDSVFKTMSLDVSLKMRRNKKN